MRKKAATALILSLLLILLPTAAYASGTYAIVTGSVVNVRAYGEINTSNRLFQVNRGTEIEIHDVYGDFFQATINGTEDVFISRDWVRITQTIGTVTSEFTWVYDLPEEAGGEAIALVEYGEILTVTYVYEDWYGIKFEGATAFVGQSDVETPDFAELPTARFGNTVADIIIATSKNYLGVPYRWGGNTPAGFDCSGFMVYLFSAHGIQLHRRSRDQARNGIFVPRSELQQGDLVFFNPGGGSISHVGLYIGYGNFIHASSSGGIRICSLHDTHNRNTFVTARRVIL